jgi:hypothetical protein
MRVSHWLSSLVLVLLSTLVASGLLMPVTAQAEAEVLLSMPEPPDGYMVLKQPMVSDGKHLGQTVMVVKEDSPARVVISVETSFDRSTKPARVAATKGYVNGTAGTLKKMGMERVDTQLPDLEQADFTTPLQIDMTFAQADGTKLYIRQLIFFTKHGYNIQIGAANPQDVESLANWAERIKPAE